MLGIQNQFFEIEKSKFYEFLIFFFDPVIDFLIKNGKSRILRAAGAGVNYLISPPHMDSRASWPLLRGLGRLELRGRAHTQHARAKAVRRLSDPLN